MQKIQKDVTRVLQQTAEKLELLEWKDGYYFIKDSDYWELLVYLELHTTVTREEALILQTSSNSKLFSSRVQEVLASFLNFQKVFDNARKPLYDEIIKALEYLDVKDNEKIDTQMIIAVLEEFTQLDTHENKESREQETQELISKLSQRKYVSIGDLPELISSIPDQQI